MLFGIGFLELCRDLAVIIAATTSRHLPLGLPPPCTRGCRRGCAAIAKASRVQHHLILVWPSCSSNCRLTSVCISFLLVTSHANVRVGTCRRRPVILEFTHSWSGEKFHLIVPCKDSLKDWLRRTKPWVMKGSHFRFKYIKLTVL